MINAHIEDGVALTKFLYWIKKQKINNLTEKKIEKKLESFRKSRKIICTQVLIQLLDLDQMEQLFTIDQISFLIEN